MFPDYKTGLPDTIRKIIQRKRPVIICDHTNDWAHIMDTPEGWFLVDPAVMMFDLDDFGTRLKTGIENVGQDGMEHGSKKRIMGVPDKQNKEAALWAFERRTTILGSFGSCHPGHFNRTGSL